jgi:hypothetical protein
MGFNQRVSSDVAAQVDLWDTIKALPGDQAELLNRVRGATTQAERQQQSVLRKEAQDILTRSDNGVTGGQKLLNSAIGEFGGTFWSANIGAPLARQSLAKEFNTYFVEAYAKTGNETAASDLALKQLQREWAVTSVGGGKDLMKYPPEKTGYRPINGSYDWINESVRKDLQIKPEEDFDLYSDEQTREEFQKFQRDAGAQPPSYRVFVKDENGVYRERYNEQGRPLRVNFIPSAEAKEAEARAFDWRDREFRARETIFNYQAMQAAAAGDISDEDTAAYNAAVADLAAMDEERGNAEKAGAAIGGQFNDGSRQQSRDEFLFGDLARGKTFRESLGIKLRRD